MNADEFVASLVQAVRDPAISGTRARLERPPGRAPREKLVRLSGWYRSLAPADRERVLDIVGEAVDDAIFGLLCVLDGVRSIQKRPHSGEQLRLTSVSSDQEVLLNDFAEEFLHDRYQEAVGRVE